MVFSLFYSLLITSLVLSLLMLLFAFISRAFPRLMSSRTRYAIWILSLLALLIPIRPLLGLGFWTWTPPHIRLSSASQGSSLISSSSSNWAMLLLYALISIWLLGSLWQLLSHLRQYRKLRQLVDRVGQEVTDPAIQKQFQQLLDYLMIKNRQIKLIRCHFIKSPMLTGIRKPVILLPEQDLTSEELEVVLEHELTHYLHRDILINLLMIVATSLHWFNPLVRFSNRVINEEGEIYCDEDVLRGKNMDYRRFYGKTIIQLIENGEPRTISLSTHFFDSKMNLQHRLIAILDMNKPLRRLSYLTLLSALATIFLATSVLVLANEVSLQDSNKQTPAKTSETRSTSSSQSSSQEQTSENSSAISQTESSQATSPTTSSNQASNQTPQTTTAPVTNAPQTVYQAPTTSTPQVSYQAPVDSDNDDAEDSIDDDSDSDD